MQRERLLLDNVSNNKYNNDLRNKCKVIYHGAEPNLRYAITNEAARLMFSLPSYKSIKIALAIGFATNTKGWDILKEMHVPENWIIGIVCFCSLLRDKYNHLPLL